MTITKTQDGKRVTLKLNGWLDTTTSGSLAAETETITGVESILFDFAELEYISSAGLRQVVATARKAKDMGAEFAVENVGKDVMAVFTLTGLNKKIHITAKE